MIRSKIVPYEEIIIDWGDRIELSSIDDIFNDTDKNSNVLYQIYGSHHIYGPNVLLYIGKTERNFAKRLDEHLKSFFLYANNLSFSIGTLVNYEDQLDIPESILIANHKPALNKTNIHTVQHTEDKRKIIIINNGNHGMLKNSCTNFWWVNGNNE